MFSGPGRDGQFLMIDQNSLPISVMDCGRAFPGPALLPAGHQYCTLHSPHQVKLADWIITENKDRLLSNYCDFVG